MKYLPSIIEPKWQKKWEDTKIFSVSNDLKELKNKPKFYALDMFPYPSGAGLHVGHPEGYTATDVVARYKKMSGFNVLHVMGWDAFGLPAERAAMRENIHPSIITKRNINNFRGQIKRLGFFYDWSREISTTDENYYKWTQWIFLKLHEKKLAYLADIPVNWCPKLKTVLANEEVKDGKYIETQDPVEKKIMRQWMLKITAYAERLLTDLDELDWPENVKEMQRNWIGKSYGASVKFSLDNNEYLEVYTTRPDTIFGVTFLALAVEHPLAKKLTLQDRLESANNFIDSVIKQDEVSRTDNTKEKLGFFTGSYAVHPINKNKIPIYLADYVLPNYALGCVMGVPSEDDRDREFANKYQIPIIEVIKKINNKEFLTNSDFINELTIKEAQEKIIKYLTKNNLGQEKVEYKLRDWLFSRQRYWGEPFPIAYTNDNEAVALEYSDLPVTLPEIDEYKPTDDGRPPLARASKEWLNVLLSNGKMATREVNTMPQWAGSCWYYLRYLDPHNEKEPFSKELENYWMPVDLYIGGVEHAVLHLLYARFWHKVLYDCGLVSTKEPFQKLFNQGMIIATSYRDKEGKYYHPSEVYEKNGKFFSNDSEKELIAQVEKMSKSKSNVINPDEVINQYGADAMRLYELFMGPLEQVKPWQMNGVEGIYRFLNRVWRLAIDEDDGNISKKVINDSEALELNKLLHKTIKKVSEDIENLSFNTAISQMMIFVNEATAQKNIAKSTIITFLHLLSPFAPHICDEILEKIGEPGSLLSSKWPVFDKNLIEDETLEIAIQINGKKRSSLLTTNNMTEEELKNLALSNQEIQKFIKSKSIIKTIVVPKRIINIVVKDNE